MQPTFLGIGVPGGATTWLYEILDRHPEIWMTPYKELHYFDSDTPLFNKKEYMRIRLQKQLRRYVYGILRNPAGLKELPWKWDLRYFLGRRDHAWYISLFCPGPNQIAGEITPAYMSLERAVVGGIAQLNPELKVFFIMRDPLDRAWSMAVKHLARNRRRPLDSIPDHEIFDHFQKQQLDILSDYPRTLNNWEDALGHGQVFTGFFEEVQNNPREFLLRLYRFLGISAADGYIPKEVTAKVNSTESSKTAFPIRFQKYLARECVSKLPQLSQRFGEPVTGWLRRAEKLLDD